MVLSKNSLRVISFVLLSIFIAAGLRVSLKKDLWNDEIYSQLSSISKMSYVHIISGRIQEGNNTPLFYLIQKALGDVFHYQTPLEWEKGNWDHGHPFSNIFLRIPAVMGMSLALVLLFYYFSRRYSFWTGLYALAVAISSYMVWAYAFEARPYALWFLLTTLQGLIFLETLKSPNSHQLRIGLFGVHLALSLTVILSVIQVTAVLAILFLLDRSKWRRYLGFWLIPAAVSVFYYTQAPKYNFWFAEGFMGLIGASLPLDRLFILALFGFIWFLILCIQKGWFPLLKGQIDLSVQELRQSAAYGLLVTAVLGGFFAVLMMLKFKESPDLSGFQISNRYFMCLAPLGIIAVSLFSFLLTKAFKWPLKALVLIMLAVLLLWRSYRSYALVVSLHIF